jgi:hypothetical protein
LKLAAEMTEAVKKNRKNLAPAFLPIYICQDEKKRKRRELNGERY